MCRAPELIVEVQAYLALFDSIQEIRHCLQMLLSQSCELMWLRACFVQGLASMSTLLNASWQMLNKLEPAGLA